MQKHSGTFPQSPIPRFPSSPKRDPEKGPLPPASMPLATTALQPDTPEDRRPEGLEVRPPEQALGFPPAGLPATQTQRFLPLLALPKPHDEPSVKAVLKELLDDAGHANEKVLQALSQATPQIKALLLEMITKTMGSPHCTTGQLCALIAAYAPHVALRRLLSPIWAPSSPDEPPVSGLDRLCALAARLAAAPEQLNALQRLAGDRWSSPTAWDGWAVLFALGQFIQDSPQAAQWGEGLTIREFLHQSMWSGGQAERRALVDDLWLSAVVNGLSPKVLDDHFMFSEVSGVAPVSNVLRDRSQHPRLLARLCPARCSDLGQQQQLALLNDNLARMAVRNPRLLPLLAPQGGDSWSSEDVERATASVEFTLQWWTASEAFAPPLIDLPQAVLAPLVLDVGRFWSGLARLNPEWWDGVLSRHPWLARVIDIVNDSDANSANNADNAGASDEAAGSAIVRWVHQHLKR